ncbi:MAG: aspartate 1-decarboxylase [Candidatus Omnitrophota bacterium]|jgi:aspartate 1-decarboxylase
MMIEFLKSKIAHGTVTEADLHYEGSITVDRDLLSEANIIPGEKVQVLNINNGQRFETYAIEGDAGSGVLCLNGPAARLSLVGDKIMIISYCLLAQEEAKSFKSIVINLDTNNKIR